jgi:hypothetical protein
VNRVVLPSVVLSRSSVRERSPGYEVHRPRAVISVRLSPERQVDGDFGDGSSVAMVSFRSEEKNTARATPLLPPKDVEHRVPSRHNRDTFLREIGASLTVPVRSVAYGFVRRFV